MKNKINIIILVSIILMMSLTFISAGYTSCTDSDGTNDKNKGYITTVLNGHSSTTFDVCNNENNVAEQTCDGKTPKAVFYYCPSGFKCYDGACKESGYTSCTDSDGTNTKNKGYITTVLNGHSSTTFDVCNNENNVAEQTCDGKTPKAVFYDCPSGFKCYDGACKESGYTSCTDSDGTNTKNKGYIQ